MFGKKKDVPEIDKEQLELIKKAQYRIKQKKRLYAHFVIFLIGSVFLILFNLGLGIGEEFKLLDTNWFVFAILAWLFLLVYHLFNVFVTNKFLSRAWEQQQLNLLVAKQKERISQLEKTLKVPEAVVDITSTTEEKKTKVLNGLTLIVAAGENDAIGKDNQLIWHLRDDLKRFKTLTSGHIIIMGRKTFESFPKPLPNRKHIVITRQQDFKAPHGVIVVNDLEDALKVAKSDAQPFVIGGGEIYSQAILYADKIELTRVHENFEADTFFPKIDKTIWKQTSNTFHPKDENHEYAFSFLTFVRK